MASVDPGFCGHCGTRKKWLFRLESYCPNDCDRNPPDYREDDWTWPDGSCPSCGSTQTEPFAGMMGLMHCIKCGKVWQ